MMSDKGESNREEKRETGRALVLQEMNSMGVLPLFACPSAPAAGLNMTTDLAPLFVGLFVMLGLCVLGLVGALGVQDMWWDQRRNPTVPHPMLAPHLSDAA